MSAKDSKFEEFYCSLITKKKINLVNKLGLLDTTMNLSRFDNNKQEDFLLKDFLVFNAEGVLILHTQLLNYVTDYDTFVYHIRNLVIYFNKIFRPKQSLFGFHKIFIKNFKIFFLFKTGLTCVGVMGENGKNTFGKLILMHMYVALINFKGDSIERVKGIKCGNGDISSGKNEVEVRNEGKIQTLEYNSNDFYEFKIYELYFSKYLALHFQKLFLYVIKKEEIFLSYLKFKNMYLIDLSNEEILFDMLALRRSSKNIKYYQNDKLWMELMHQSRLLVEAYKGDYGYNYNSLDLLFRFVKFECTSTYPRLTFFIKFLPILKGMSMILIYSQKKLSRMTENNDHPTIKGYKEIDLLYGSEVKSTNTVEYHYSDPKKIQEIEKFFIDFFISIRSFVDIYRDNDPNRELKYFNYSIVKAINDIPTDNRPHSTIEHLIKKINAKLYEYYLNIRSNGADQINPESKNDIEREGENNISKFFTIDKEDILNDLFKLNCMNSRSHRDEEEEENGLRYIKDKDGWFVRTLSNRINTGNGNSISIIKEEPDNTLTLTKLEDAPPRVDYTLNISKKISFICKEDESEVYFAGQRAKNEIEPGLETIDNLVNDMDDVTQYNNEIQLRHDTNLSDSLRNIHDSRRINFFEALKKKGKNVQKAEQQGGGESARYINFSSEMIQQINTPVKDHKEILLNQNVNIPELNSCLAKHDKVDRVKDIKGSLTAKLKTNQKKEAAPNPHKLVMLDDNIRNKKFAEDYQFIKPEVKQQNKGVGIDLHGGLIRVKSAQPKQKAHDSDIQKNVLPKMESNKRKKAIERKHSALQAPTFQEQNKQNENEQNLFIKDTDMNEAFIGI